jgi:diguanylate cyclase (GGDEF)-like protein/putative nucleotidyltransferase with HDIG domain
VSGKSRNEPRPSSSVKIRIAGGFAFLCLIFAVAAGASAWQERIHRSNLQELDRHSSTATLLQETEAQAGIAALLLQRYVVTGDPDYPAEIEQHADAAVESITEAVTYDPPGVNEIAVSGIALADGATRVVTLRDAGDVEGASAAMETIVPMFRDYRLQLEAATASELELVAANRESADRAGDLAFLFLIGSGAIGITIALLTSALITRSIIKPLSSLEHVAAAATRGDLSVRAPAGGPRELAHLGATLNHMMSAVETRTQELSRAYQELKDRNEQLTDARVQAATDPLTDLGNHRSFHKRIREQVTEVTAAGTPVSLILFDIDGFKGINDSLGHLAGDEILRQLARIVTDVVDPKDAYRYGGDEFAVLLEGGDKRIAVKTAERLRETLEKRTTEIGQRLTVSLGVASFPEMAASAEELVYRADMAMYWAKSTGKNRVGDWDGLLSRRSGDSPMQPRERVGASSDVVASLVAALSAKDPTTRDHTERCSWYSADLAQELSLDEEDVEVLRLASLLHDIGKLAMPGEVLSKPGPLDEHEWEHMREHPVTGMHMLSEIDSIAAAVPAITHHHERYDGTGYPDGLAGEEIPLASRVLMVTDAFDAMTSDRPYRKAMPVEDALKELQRNAGTQFDPEILEAFVRMIGRHGIHPSHQASNGHSVMPQASVSIESIETAPEEATGPGARPAGDAQRD